MESVLNAQPDIISIMKESVVKLNLSAESSMSKLEYVNLAIKDTQSLMVTVLCLTKLKMSILVVELGLMEFVLDALLVGTLVLEMFANQLVIHAEHGLLLLEIVNPVIMDINFRMELVWELMNQKDLSLTFFVPFGFLEYAKDVQKEHTLEMEYALK